MTRPCEVIRKVDIKTRTLTYKKVDTSSFILFNEPKHCDICAKAIRLWTSVGPIKEVRVKPRTPKAGPKTETD